MKLDLSALTEFEEVFNTILDTLDGLRKLDPPKESGGEREQVKWFEKFSQIMKSMPSVPDVDRLSRFSDGLGKMLAKLNRNLAAPPEREEPFERLYGVQGGKITALYTLAGAAWTTSRGYPVYATVNPCHADGTAANVALTRGVALPLQASRATAVGDVVQWIVGIGTYDVGAVTIHGVVLAGIVPDVGLPVYDDAATGKMLHVRLSWNTSVEPDTKFGYKTGWVIESDNHDCFERIGESETALPAGGGADTHVHAYTVLGHGHGYPTADPDWHVTGTSGDEGPVEVTADEGATFVSAANHTHPISYHPDVTTDTAAGDNIPVFVTVWRIKWIGGLLT